MYVEVRLRGERLIMRWTEESNKIVMFLWGDFYILNV